MPIRLFIADGEIPGSDPKPHRYIGEFEVADDPPYWDSEALDRLGEFRTVIVFRLRPVGDRLRRAEDVSSSHDARPDKSSSSLVAVEAHDTTTFTTAGHGPSTAARRESDLVTRYTAHLNALGRAVRRWHLRPPGEVHNLLTDIYDEAAQELYEAKGTATRNAVRQAIGQLLDYRRHVDVIDLKLCILLPHRPSDDLLDLVLSCGMACVFEDRGKFVRVAASL